MGVDQRLNGFGAKHPLSYLGYPHKEPSSKPNAPLTKP